MNTLFACHVRSILLPFLPIMLFLLAGCSDPASNPTPAPTQPESDTTASAAAAAVGSCGLDLDDASDEETIQAVLAAEGELVVEQNIDNLMLLWTDDGQIVDAKNTPDDATDDRAWDGIDAIRHRYVRTVFPGAPSAAQPADMQITLDGDQATVAATTQIGDEVSPAGDRWSLLKVDGCWVLESLTYNLEPSP